MEVEEARKILGPKYDGLPDELIEKMIKLFSLYSQLAISQHIAEKKNKIRTKVEQSKSALNKDWHKIHVMPSNPTLDQKIQRHLDHVAHCKCRPMPDTIKKEIQKRLG